MFRTKQQHQFNHKSNSRFFFPNSMRLNSDLAENVVGVKGKRTAVEIFCFILLIPPASKLYFSVFIILMLTPLLFFSLSPKLFLFFPPSPKLFLFFPPSPKLFFFFFFFFFGPPPSFHFNVPNFCFLGSSGEQTDQIFIFFFGGKAMMLWGEENTF